MFETMAASFAPEPYRLVDPPTAVLVRVSLALGQVAGDAANSLPLRVTAEGLAVDCDVPGEVRAWARTNRGSWLALVSFSVPTGNGRGYLKVVDQWAPASAVRPTGPSSTRRHRTGG